MSKSRSKQIDKCALLNDNLSLDNVDINNNSKLDFFELNKKEENISQNKRLNIIMKKIKYESCLWK